MQETTLEGRLNDALWVRDFSEADLPQLTALYQEVFAGEVALSDGTVFSWGEYMKCSRCGVKYGRDEIGPGAEPRYKVAVDGAGFPLESCKRCGDDFRPATSSTQGGASLMPFWSDVSIREIVASTLGRPGGQIKLAFREGELLGFAMYFVNPYAPDVGYLADIGVSPDRRGKGIATALLSFVDQWAVQKRLSSVYLRTDQRNLAAVRLFEKNDYRSTGLREPDTAVEDFPWRIYMQKRLGPFGSPGDSDRGLEVD